MKYKSYNLHYSNELLKCFCVCLVTALLSVIYFIILGKGVMVVRDDFNLQQIPFITLLNSIWKDGLDGWTWNLDLGTSTIQGFSFYELGSPFFWITTLFPREWIPYIVGWLYIVKYVFAGMFSFMYLRRFVKDYNYAIIGALLYAFSGFQTTNLLFFHFHDVVAFFPLLLIGLEQTMENNRDNKLFVFAVFINSLVNYFFFVQEVVFLVIYFLLRFGTKNMKLFLKRIGLCLINGIWGIAMSAILLLPSFLYIRGNVRCETKFYLSNLVWDSKYFLMILKGLLYPGEAMCDHSSIVLQNWNSTSCYLPMVGLALVFAYGLTKNDWLTKLMKCLCIMSFMPILSSIFLMATAIYQRWWYMFVLMMALASVIVLENVEEYNVKKGTVMNIIFLALFYVVVRYMKWSSDEGCLVFHPKRFLCYFLLSLSAIVLVWILLKLKTKRYHAIILGVVCFSVVTTASTLYFYRNNSTTPEDYLEEFSIGSQLECLDEQYRYNSNDNVLMLTGNAAGMGSFSSTVANSIWKFDALFDYYSINIRMDKNEIPGVAQLLGGKYYVTQESSGGTVIKEYDSAKGNKYYVTEKDACPIGYAVQQYILKDDLMSIEREKRGIALLVASVIEKEDETAVSDLISKVTSNEINFDKTVDQYVTENSQGAVSDFSRDSHGFTCKTAYLNDTVVYFSVPYDDGWSAYIDGKQEKIIESGGMMLLKVPEGQHDIQFHYSTPGYKAGKYISIITILGFSCYCIIDNLKKKRQV